MLSLILATSGVITTLPFITKNNIWPTIISQTSIIFMLSTQLINNNEITLTFNNDNISTPLIVLSFWLIPVSLLASVGHLQSSSESELRLFIALIIVILTALIITFSTTNLILFFIGFETTLVPTLFLITRWGMQQERIEASYYFVFYTLASSLPLLLSLITIYNNESHLSIPLFYLYNNVFSSNTIVVFCILAFLVKVPIFGLHLWLPKAHVEAPVAGSMILAAILLKLGGYGFIRLVLVFTEIFQNSLSSLVIPFCCWGGALTSIICITQTDLKSLIAYSSVSHMSFMIAGMSPMSNWGLAGGIIVMIAHGLVSSALFCIANIYYERTGTRNLSANRGIKGIFLILPTFWLLLAGANLGLPPFPNAIGELLIFSGIVSKNLTNFIPTLIGISFTGMFSLIIYQQLNSGSLFKWNNISITIKEREYITLSLHTLPLIILITNPNIITF